ncbi:hydantoinase/oxoprolinase family protein [Humitalea sp. 24SJ18S-53]|uniref:hydantoinase/oxoprolinase family protein n=1 Tax=Humitalea sp. 24SJ18S-53 TaxID=3422307 RepID=UPI003D67567C
MSLGIGIDIGGTFTDFALEWRRDDNLLRHTLKLPTTTRAPEKAVLEGLPQLLAMAGATPGDVTRLVHGTTLATNALIERRGARTAFLTTEGFRDVLATGNESRAAQYELFYRKPAPLVPRRWRLPVGGRIGAAGQVLAPLDEAVIIRHAADMAAGGIESVAVGYLHAYAAPAQERRTRELLATVLPGVPVSLSCEVSPEIREYERFCTTVANAYVQPIVAAYLRRLEAGLRAQGFGVAMLLMLSSGGLATVETAMRFPVRLLESGPAGGAVFAARIARDAGLPRALAFDMGGTTAKLCLLEDGVPRTDRVFEVDRTYRFAKGSGMPVRVPVVELVEIGAGGGSIARVDATGRLAVGPESAGSEPGPACFARGGTAPTVSDANLVLGRLAAEGFAGGRMRLDAAAAGAALLTLAPDRAAADLAVAVTEVVESAMAAAARVHAAERGAGLEDRVLVAFGGGAPLHALRLARRLGVTRVIVPAGAGVGSAFGFLWANPSYEAVRGYPGAVAALDMPALEAAFLALAAEAEAVVAPALAAGAALQTRRSAQLRYRGQGQEVSVPLPADAPSVAMLEAAFLAAYTAQYGAPIPGVGVELVAIAVTVSGPPEASAMAPSKPVAQAVHGVATRWMRDPDGGAMQCPVLARDALVAGAHAVGPLLVVEDATTTVIPAGCTLHVDARGHLVIDLPDAQGEALAA